MPATEGSEPVRASKSQKSGPSSDWSLQPDSMKAESLVIADQLRRGEYVPGSCTHRPSHHESRLVPKIPEANPASVGRQGSTDWPAIGVKS